MLIVYLEDTIEVKMVALGDYFFSGSLYSEEILA
jgi:hypothetical protein